VTEKVFFMELLGDPKTDNTLVLLRNREGNQAVALHFNVAELPWFTLWKNPAALADGYVTGLEPATNLPNVKGFERQQGRVIPLASGQSHTMSLTIEASDSAEKIRDWEGRIKELQSNAQREVYSHPQLPFCPVG
jgi:hypothetical protein